MLVVLVAASACGEDSAVATSSAGIDTLETGTDTEGAVTLTTSVSASDSGTDTREPTDGTASDSTSLDTTVGDTGDTGDTDDTTDGEPAMPGRSMSQMVSAGERAMSESYTTVFTVGQPTKLQSTHTSANYRMQGGLIGANGSPP